jgi:hypothetical protein
MAGAKRLTTAQAEKHVEIGSIWDRQNYTGIFL